MRRQRYQPPRRLMRVHRTGFFVYIIHMSDIPVLFSLENVGFRYEEGDKPVFDNFSIDLPEGIISFVGQNGAGKSTLLLLAGARLLPQTGRVMVYGNDSKTLTTDEDRNELVSFIYQNLEFDTEEPVGALLDYIYENGFHEKKDGGFLKDVKTAFELNDVLNKKTQELSKGGLQRTIMAFSLLYGSKAIMMDEPIFALEDHQKQKAMGFMTEYARGNRMPLYYSAHELEITNNYSDFMLLLFSEGGYILGPTAEVATDANLERAFGIPRSMMYQKEKLHRQHLKDFQEHIVEDNAPFN